MRFFRTLSLGPAWVNRSQQKFAEVPSFLAVLSSRPLAEVADEATRREPCGEEGDRDEREREARRTEDEARPEPTLEPVVEDLLQQHGDDEVCRGRGEGDDRRGPQRPHEIRALAQARDEHAPSLLQVRRDRQVLVLEELDRDAHRSPRSYARTIAA